MMVKKLCFLASLLVPALVISSCSGHGTIDSLVTSKSVSILDDLLNAQEDINAGTFPSAHVADVGVDNLEFTPVTPGPQSGDAFACYEFQDIQGNEEFDLITLTWETAPSSSYIAVFVWDTAHTEWDQISVLVPNSTRFFRLEGMESYVFDATGDGGADDSSIVIQVRVYYPNGTAELETVGISEIPD